MEINERQDQLAFKQAIRETEKLLATATEDKSLVTRMLEPAEKLLDDMDFWFHLLDTLVVFISPEEFNYYLIPHKHNRMIEVSSEFYLLPLIGTLGIDDHYLLLKLSKKAVRLYNVSQSGVNEIDTMGLIPENFREIAGSDVEQKTLQFHSANPVTGASAYHGHGAGKDDERAELIEFFRAIDRGINSLIPDQHAPLLIACVDGHFGEYAAINKYDSLFARPIAGNPDDVVTAALAARGWTLLEERAASLVSAKTNAYRELNIRELTSSMPTEIIPACYNGKVETMFVSEGARMFGRYDAKLNSVELHEEKSGGDTDLLNRAAIEVMRHRGQVLVMAQPDLPEPLSPVNAIYRY